MSKANMYDNIKDDIDQSLHMYVYVAALAVMWSSSSSSVNLAVIAPFEFCPFGNTSKFLLVFYEFFS
uniref:Uncharacterized protein n=1 Tax=Glossina palpalis gambiensis TaxID=67801 RepID=A0A1B0BKE1_9MUSC